MNAVKEWYYRLYHQYDQGRRLRALKAHLQRGQPIALVHQMGRAASMTMTNTLRAMELDMPIHHTHWLNPETVARRMARMEQSRGKIESFNLRVSKLMLDNLPPERMRSYPWRIVSIIRDPVARNLSAYFLSIEGFIDDVYRRHAQGRLKPDELLEVFLRDYPHDIPLNWFDLEVNEVFGMNVYARPFLFDLDYALYEAGPLRMAVIKVESLERTYRPALQALFGEAPGELRNTHISVQDEPYAPIYKSFLAAVRLPQDYLDRMYDSVYARHFYRPEELAAFRKKWGG